MIRLALFALLLALLLELAVAQYRFFQIDVGSTTTDAFLRNFRDPETETPEQGGYSFQWTRAESGVLTPGLDGVWEATVRFRQRPEDPPTSVAFTGGGVELRVNPTPGVYRYHLVLTNANELKVVSDLSGNTLSETGSLGIAVDTITLTRREYQPTLHPWVWLAAALLAFFLGWVAGVARMGGRDTLLLFAGAALILVVAALAYTPYLLVLLPIVCGLIALALPLGLVLDWLLQRRAAHLAGPVLAIFVCLVVVKLAGTLFPAYLPTDTLFHGNRFQFTVAGDFYTTAFGQGQTYPYPPGTYLLIAPLALLYDNLRWLIPVSSIIIDATTVFLLAHVLRPYGRVVVGWAALLYAIMPVAVLVHWQGGFTQSVGQWFGIAFIMALITKLDDGRWTVDGGKVNHRITPSEASRHVRRPLFAIFFLALLATVGHFGVLLNLGLMSVILGGMLLLRRERLGAALLFPVAALIMLLVYYSAFGGLFVEQLGNLTASGEGEGGDSRLFLLWRFVWELGIRDHYFWGIYLALAVWALFRWLPPLPRTPRLRLVLGAMLLTSLVLAIASVTILFNGTRYVVFVYPAVACLAAFALAGLAKRRWGWTLTRALVMITVLSSLAMWAGGVALDRRIGFLL